MAMRSGSVHTAPRRWLMLTCIVLIVLALLPARWSGWTVWFGGVADFVIAPVQWPMAKVVSWLSPARAPTTRDPVTATLERELALTKDAYYRVARERDEFERQVTALQRGLAITGSLPFKQLVAGVIGTHTDGSVLLLRLRAGARDGVVDGAVAVSDSVSLVGRVPRGGVGDRVSRLIPITDRSVGAINVLVFPGEGTDGASGLGTTSLSVAAQVSPTGRGDLSGPVEAGRYKPGEEPLRLVPGMVARLDDPRWPRWAQMLLVGTIVRVETQPNGRDVVWIKPGFELPLTDVVLRIPDESDRDGPPGDDGVGPLQDARQPAKPAKPATTPTTPGGGRR